MKTDSNKYSGLGRVAEIDALRGLAAVGVMLFHFTTQYDKEVGHVGADIPSFGIGNFGVQLFFMISGYVITMSLDRTKSPGDFLVSRFSRIFPTYWAAICITAAVVYTIGLPAQRIAAFEVALNLTMIQELLRARSLDGSYWTLQVELLFYAQMFALARLGLLRHLAWIVGFWLLVVSAYYIGDQTKHYLSWTLGQLLLIQHIPFFAIGMLYHRLATSPQLSRSSYLLIGACLVVISFTREPPYFLAALICTGVFFAINARALHWLTSPTLLFLGSISYPLYLLHQDIGFALIWHLERDAHLPSTLAIATATAACLALAVAASRYIERPSIEWIRTQWRQRKA